MSSPPELPENLLKRETSGRRWNGVQVVVTEFTCGGRVLHQMPHGPETRLGVILEEVGRGRCEPALLRFAASRIGQDRKSHRATQGRC